MIQTCVPIFGRPKMGTHLKKLDGAHSGGLEIPGIMYFISNLYCIVSLPPWALSETPSYLILGPNCIDN